MTEYDFISNDWTTLSSCSANNLATETAYHEQMLRWSLRYARWWGVARIGDDDLVVNPGQNDYEVSLRACKAFTKHGHIIEVSRGGEVLSLQGSNKDHSADTRVPIYVGVSTQKQAFSAGASQSGAIDQRFLLRSRLKLAHQPESAEYEWLQIGRMLKVGTQFTLDPAYIPHCLHINSYPAMKLITSDIAFAAQAVISAIETAVKTRAEGPALKPLRLHMSPHSHRQASF